jgi:predicted NUDIX family NTP pyrophosphohydrolase
MPKKSAAVLLYRGRRDDLEVLLVHPGGPFWAKKDEAAWSLPKGEFNDDEDPQEAARREFTEETGMPLRGEMTSLGTIRQSSGKIIYAWASKGDFDPAQLKSNTFSMEWPPKSGRTKEFPEVDQAAWFTLGQARQKIVKGQAGLLDRLVDKLSG